MINRGIVLVVAASFALGACGGGGGAESNTANDAKADVSPTEELKALSADLQASMDALMQPVTDAESLVNDLTSLPAKLNLNASALAGLVKATLDSGTVSVSADLNLDENAKAEVEAALKKLKGIGDGLKAIPDRVGALGGKLAAVVAQVPLLATKVTASAQATVANPFASDEDKAKAQADLSGITKLQADVMAQIQDAQKKVLSIPGLAVGALAKLSASLTT